MNQQEIAFMGRITASLSHEINNVLAIIKESAGLMDDILRLCPENVVPHQDRLIKASASIRKQVDRGVDIVTGLNRFAHSTDEPWAQVDLNELTARIAFLMQRFGRKRRIRLSAVPHPEPLMIQSDPFRLEMLLAAGLDFCLARADEGSGIVLQTQLVDGRPAIWMGSDTDSSPSTFAAKAPCPGDLLALQADLEHLKADIFDVGTTPLPGLLIQFR
jgi:phosphoglycerate-specific signal transduction histidine kinase